MKHLKRHLATSVRVMLDRLEVLGDEEGGDKLRQYWRDIYKKSRALDPIVELLMVPFFHILIRYNKYPELMPSRQDFYNFIRLNLLVPFLQINCPDMSEIKIQQYLDSLRHLIDDDISNYSQKTDIHEHVQMHKDNRDFPLQGFFSYSIKYDKFCFFI